MNKQEIKQKVFDAAEKFWNWSCRACGLVLSALLLPVVILALAICSDDDELNADYDC